MEQDCKRVKGGWAKSCLACGKAKQKCVGMVWEGGEGLNRMLMGELTGLVWELVGEMKGFREELMEMKEVVEKGLRNIVKSNHLWHQTAITDVMDYVEWWAEFQQEEMDQQYQELWLEDGMYWKYLKEKIDEGELDRLVDKRVQDYGLEEGEVGVGPESRFPRWIWRSNMSEKPWVLSFALKYFFFYAFYNCTYLNG